jgi:hypothetical protein
VGWVAKDTARVRAGARRRSLRKIFMETSITEF